MAQRQVRVDRFVGRADELREVLAACRTAGEGRGSLTVVSGVAGIGKTRLCQEVRDRARRDGVHVVMARCWSDGGAPPLWPWKPILDELCGEHAFGLLAREGDLPTGARDRFARFAAVADEVATASRRRPTCLIIDDVHAADAGSLLLARFLARSLHHIDLALVLARRPGEPGPDSVEGRLLDEIEAEASLVTLHPLDSAEATELLAANGLAEVDRDALAIILRVTAGHPLFLRRVAAGGRPGPAPAAGDLPHGLRDAIDQAAERIPPESRVILRTAAVLGNIASVTETAAVARAGTEAVLDAVAAGQAAGLVMSGNGGRFSFAHDLVRAVLLDGLRPADRLAAHARAARSLSGDTRQAPPDHLVRRAHHALAAAPRSAEDARLAVDACRTAARALVRTFAYEQADGLLSAATALHEPPGLGAPPAALLVEWSQAALLCGRLADARARFARAVTAAEYEGDPVLLAEAGLGLGGYWLTESRDPLQRARVTAVQRAALEALPEEHEALRCRIVARLAAEDCYNGGPVEPVFEALEGAHRCGDPAALADAISLCHHALLRPEHTHERLRLAEDLVLVGAAAGHGVLGLMGLCWRTLDLFDLGDPRAVRALEELRERADALACQVVLYIVTLLDVMLLIRAGRLDEAEAAAEACYKLGTDVGDPDAFVYLGAQVAVVRWLQGRTGELVELMDDIATSPALHHVDFAYRASGAVFAHEAGQHEQARQVLDRLVSEGLEALPRSGTWLAGMMAVAELAAAVGDPAAARKAYDLLEPFADLPIVPSVGIVCFGSTHRPLAVAARTFGRPDLALDHLTRAVAANRRLGNRPLTVLAQAERADLLAAHHPERRPEARRMLAEAVERAEDMGMAGRAAAWRRRLRTLEAAEDEDGIPVGDDDRPAEAGATGGLMAGPDATSGPGATSDADAGAGTTAPREVGTGRAPPPPHPEPSPPGASPGSRRRGTIRREGTGWYVGVGDRHVHLPDLVGVSYLAVLVTRPGQAVPALTLAGQGDTVDPASPQELLDGDARDAYVARARELAAELGEAEAHADIGRASRLRAEMDALVEQLQTATGLGGRPRLFAGSDERARTAVRKAIKRAVEAIDAEDPRIARHLRSAISTGRTCTYIPDPDDPVTWSTDPP